MMCRLLEVSRAGFNAAQRRPPSARAVDDARLCVDVRTEFRKSRRRFWAPRIMRALRTRDVRVSTKRIARVMRADGLVAHRPRRSAGATPCRLADGAAPDRLALDFAVRDTRPLNIVWVSDVTFIPTRMGWLYLAIVLDLASRRIVGWATSAQNATALALMALHRTGGPPTAAGLVAPLDSRQDGVQLERMHSALHYRTSVAYE